MAGVTLLGGFNETCRHSQLFLWQQKRLFFSGSRTISIYDRINQNSCFKPNYYLFLTLTKCLSCVNQTRAYKQKEKLKIEPEQT